MCKEPKTQKAHIRGSKLDSCKFLEIGDLVLVRYRIDHRVLQEDFGIADRANVVVEVVEIVDHHIDRLRRILLLIC